MYQAYWNLHSSPFGSRIGDGWFYDSPTHEEATARLLFLIEERRPCGILTGPSGTGKTALLTHLARQLRRSQRQALLLDLCGQSGDEMLCQLADALQLTPAASSRPFLLWRGIRDHLHGLSRSQQQIVLMFDQFERAQPSCAAVIEQLLHLGHDAAGWHSVIVAGNDRTTGESLRALTRLAELRIELSPWSRRETDYYVYESLKQAGAETELFEPSAQEALFAVTGGVPRHVNRLGELALLAGMADGRRSIDAETVLAAADNLPPAMSPVASAGRSAAAVA